MNLTAKCAQYFALMLPSVGAIVFLWYLANSKRAVTVDVAFLGTALLFVNLLYFTAHALNYLQRLHARIQCSDDSDQMQAYQDHLQAHDPDRRRQALQVIADVWGHPFGLVECWPLDRMGPERVQGIAALYALAAESSARLDTTPVGGDLAERLRRSPAAQRMIANLRDRVAPPNLEPPPLPEDIDAELLALELPPMASQPFLRAMRPRVDGLLLHLAAAMNEAATGDAVPAAAGKVNERVAELCLDAIQTGLRLRLSSATGQAFPGLPVHSRGDVKPIARAQLSLLLFRIAQMYGETDARAIFPQNLPYVRRLLRNFWWSGLETGMKLRDVPAAPPSALAKATRAVGETVNECLDSIAAALRETIGDLAGIDPPASPTSAAEAPTDVGTRHTLAAPVSDRLDAAADKVKDAILDLEVAPGERAGAPELPPLDREEFIRVGREHFDRVVGEFADAINGEPTAVAIEGNTEDIHHLLGELGVILLDTAVQMRIDKAAQANAPSGTVQPGRARGKRLADIRLPPPATPRSQGGWVDKYRRMRARHGD